MELRTGAMTYHKGDGSPPKGQDSPKRRGVEWQRNSSPRGRPSGGDCGDSDGGAEAGKDLNISIERPGPMGDMKWFMGLPLRGGVGQVQQVYWAR